LAAALTEVVLEKTATKYSIMEAQVVIEKLLIKGVSKVPFVGLLIRTPFILYKLAKGNYRDAVMDTVSGAVSCIPVVGTGASIALDIGYLACTPIFKKENDNK
jgi:hypothetical protein